MFDTKIAIVVRDDLATWQKLNITAFLMSGITGTSPNIIGAPYIDADNHVYQRLCVQPIIILSASKEKLKTIHRRAVERNVSHGLFIEEMFSTGNDAANREVFLRYGMDTANVVGIALREEKKVVNMVTKGAQMHP